MKEFINKKLRKCYKCKKVFGLNHKNFNYDKSQSGGFPYLCKKCQREKGRQYVKKRTKTIPSIYKLILWRNKFKVNISMQNFEKWYNSQEKICVYCGIKEEDLLNDNLQLGRRVNRLTIDRTDNNKPYELGNIVLACYRCNSVKSNIFTFEEMKKIGKILKEKRKNPAP